jgi:hypothetical protein
MNRIADITILTTNRQIQMITDNIILCQKSAHIVLCVLENRFGIYAFCPIIVSRMGDFANVLMYSP